MSATDHPKPRVFVDADVLFAGAASPTEHGASLVIMRMAEITLIDAVASEQVVTEVDRNLAEKLPDKLPELRLLINRCLRVVSNPRPEDLAQLTGAADPKDLPILAAAVRESCPYLVTFNVRHYRLGHPQVSVLLPGEYLLRVRELLTFLAPDKE
jgi:predicted nucleic acid-binding protein